MFLLATCICALSCLPTFCLQSHSVLHVRTLLSPTRTLDCLPVLYFCMSMVCFECHASATGMYVYECCKFMENMVVFDQDMKTGEYEIPDLLDTYMKHCPDKTIGPFGGQLYHETWNPQGCFISLSLTCSLLLSFLLSACSKFFVGP